MSPIIQIQKPSLSLFSSFLNFVDDMRLHNETLWDGYYQREGENAEEFISRLNARATHPEKNWVPETTFWGTYNGEVAGRISIRHELKGNLFFMGGHIGYEVAPKFRQLGIAKEMLRLILLTPEAKKIGKMLLTCSPENIASNKTIIANGGVLEKTIFVEMVNENKNHYWITVSELTQSS